MAGSWSFGRRGGAPLRGVAALSALLLTLGACSGGSTHVADPGASAAITPAPAPSPEPTSSGAPLPSMTPDQARADTGAIHDNGCHAHHGDTAASDPEDCTFGYFDGDTVILYGDDHAEQWFTAAEGVAERHDWRLLPVTKQACPPGAERVQDESRGGVYTECARWHANAMALIEEQEPILVLIAARSDRYRVVDGDQVLSGPDSADRLGTALAEDLRAFADMGARTVLIRDTPAPGFDVPDCIAAGDPESCAYRLTGAPPDDTAQLAAAKATRTQVVDLTRSVCGGRTACRTVIDGLITMRDAEHLTSTFGATLADELEAGIEALPA